MREVEMCRADGLPPLRHARVTGSAVLQRFSARIQRGRREYKIVEIPGGCIGLLSRAFNQTVFQRLGAPSALRRVERL